MHVIMNHCAFSQPELNLFMIEFQILINTTLPPYMRHLPTGDPNRCQTPIELQLHLSIACRSADVTRPATVFFNQPDNVILSLRPRLGEIETQSDETVQVDCSICSNSYGRYKVKWYFSEPISLRRRIKGMALSPG